MNIEKTMQELNAINGEMYKLAHGTPCNFGSDLRRYEAEEVEAEKMSEEHQRHVDRMLEGSFNWQRPENFAEAMREVFAGKCCDKKAIFLLEKMRTDPRHACVFLKALAVDYWRGQAEYVARNT